MKLDFMLILLQYLSAICTKLSMDYSGWKYSICHILHTKFINLLLLLTTTKFTLLLLLTIPY